jgi:hypothetical protein
VLANCTRWPLAVTGLSQLDSSGKQQLEISRVVELRGPKVYSLHAPEVECIGKGKPHKPYEFGVKVSIATTLKRSKGGQFAIHAKACCQIIRMAANNAWDQLPFTATVVRNPSVHAQDVQGAHRVEADPFPHVIAESDIAIKLVPRLAGPD